MKANFSGERSYKNYIEQYGYEYYERLKQAQQAIISEVNATDIHPNSAEQTVPEYFLARGASLSMPAQSLVMENPSPEQMIGKLQQNWPSGAQIIPDAAMAQPQEVKELHSPRASDLESTAERRAEKPTPPERKDTASLLIQSLFGNEYTEEATVARIIRQSGGKDRHSKVFTSKGPRDRRVRLSVPTAIQFYDVQDRLGFDQPSKAVEWLIKKAKSAIDELAQLPNLSLKRLKSMQNHDPDQPSKHMRINGGSKSTSLGSSTRMADEKGAKFGPVSRDSGLLSAPTSLEKPLQVENLDCWNELEMSQSKQQQEDKDMDKIYGLNGKLSAVALPITTAPSFCGFADNSGIQGQPLQNPVTQIHVINDIAVDQNSINQIPGSCSNQQREILQYPEGHFHQQFCTNSEQNILNGYQKCFNALLPLVDSEFGNPVNSGRGLMSGTVRPTRVQQQYLELAPMLSLQEKYKADKLPASNSYMQMSGYNDYSVRSLAMEYGLKNDDSFMQICAQERNNGPEMLEEKPNRGKAL